MDTNKLAIVLDPKSNRKIINHRYKIIKKIGQGQYGKVLLGEDVTTTVTSTEKNKSTTISTYVAIKTINRIDKSRLLLVKNSSNNISMKIKREISIMKQCNHPNIVKLYQVIDDLRFDKILLILEYCQYGEIDRKRYNHYREKYRKIDTESTRGNTNSIPQTRLTLNKILRDIINGLEYLHDYKHIIHRDLKPSNLLINQDNTVKISDFGVSLLLENNANDAKELAKIMGTPAFYAPELCQFVNNRFSMVTNEDHAGNKIKISYNIDIWSLGVTLYCLLFNNLPFNGNNEFEMCKNIVKSELQFPLIKHSSKVTENDIQELKCLKDLIKKILVKDPDERISLKEIKVHPFTTFDLSELEKKKFFKFNQNIFKAEDCKKELDVDGAIPASSPQSSSLSKRIKNLFSSKLPVATTATTTTSSPPPATTLPSTPGNSSLKHTPSNLKYNNLSLKELEHVDDLLDSYLDDSSSLGSIEGDDEGVDTSNILGDLDKDTNYDHLPLQLQEKVSDLTKDATQVETKHKPQPLDLKQAVTSFPPLPPPRGNFSSSLEVTNNSNNNTSSPVTPINENITTIIGERSPVNNYNGINDNIGDFPKSSRQSFEKQNKLASLASMTYQPTIISLSSPVKTKSESWGGKPNNTSIHNSIGGISDNHKHLNMFEPPLIFRESKPQPPLEGNKSATVGNTENSFGSTSRRNSNTSQHFGYGLSRITSSSSSLNLNAYLTDDDDDNDINSALMPELNRSSSISTRYSLKGIQQQLQPPPPQQQQQDKLQNIEHNEDHDESEEGDSTIIANNYQIMRNYNDMSSYLDGLD